MKTKYKKIFFVCLLVLIFLLPLSVDIKNIKINNVSAFEVRYPIILGFSITDSSSVIDYAKYFFNIGMAIAGTLAIMAIMFGGIYYLISLNRGKFTDEGKQWIKSGVLGLIILVSAYLIAYTINPDLVLLRLERLLPVGLLGSPGGSGTSSVSPITNYEEIPLGTLTENLLSRTTDCYDYDENGDPIEAQIKTDDNRLINGPTFLNHDRADCFLKLTEASQKKAKLIKKLSDEIVKLMNQCSCAGKCDTTVPPTCRPPVGKKCPLGGYNGAACKPFQGRSNDCCPAGVKNKIEHGPIKIEGQEPQFDYSGKEFKGLDEFRTQLANVSLFVEIQPRPKVDGREIITINNGNCQLCDINNAACQNSRKSCLQNSKWGNLKLIEQLMYFKEKMEQIKSAIEKDRDLLNSARTKIAACYNIKSSVSLLGILEEAKKEEKVVSPFTDPETNKVVDASKYCEGFNYANSNSYMKCQEICPETLKDRSCYQGCSKCNENDPQKQAVCLEKQTKCMKRCYDNRQCPTATSPFATFEDCIQSFDQQCFSMCDKKYAADPGNNLKKCKAKCGSDTSSQCLLDNEEKCTVNFLQLKSCADNYSDPDDLKNCMDNSYLCKYGSDEYAGYPDCVKNQGPYSSSFLYKNPDNQKCKNPYQSYTSGPNIGQTCLDIYPETAKCPLASQCPKCPCGIISETINYNSGEGGSSDGTDGGCPEGSCLGQDGTCSPGNCGSESSGPTPPSEGNNRSSQTILEYQIVTGTCNKFSYVGDPLTFYCRTAWEPESYLSGKWLYSSGKDEIPVGQAVDDAKKWAGEFIKNVNNFTQTTAEMIQYMKDIGLEQKYCQCDSTCENGRPCASSCQYIPPKTATDTTPAIPAACSPKPCDGISCQKIINLLKGGSSKNCPVEKKGMFYYYDKLYKGSTDFYKFTAVDARTDVLKGLSYSRKTMNECSQRAVELGKDIVQTFSCTKAYRGISALEKRCYGIFDGQVQNPPEDRTDNWFCLKTLLK